MKKAFLIILLCALQTGCASQLRKWILGEEEVARAPAQVWSDNTVNGELAVMQAVNAGEKDVNAEIGPNLPENEFSHVSRLYNDRSRRGYRRNEDPWSGTGPSNEGSLWNPESQDNYYFTRNLKWKVGDFVILEIEHDLSESLNSRLSAMYRPKRKGTRRVVAEEAGKILGAKAEQLAQDATKNAAVAKSVGRDIAEETTESLSSRPRYFTTQEIPLRITEVSTRGTLRVEGEKTLFLKNGAFNLSIAGMIREEDIAASRKVASSRLMDTKVKLEK